jgi:hypothetical protein
VEQTSIDTMAPTLLEVYPVHSPPVEFKIQIPKALILTSICLGLKGFIVVYMQSKFLQQDSYFTFHSHKVDAVIRSPLFITFMFNLILSRVRHVSLITNAINMFFESKISVANR